MINAANIHNNNVCHRSTINCRKTDNCQSLELNTVNQYKMITTTTTQTTAHLRVKVNRVDFLCSISGGCLTDRGQ
jgi:hypothetical protein